MEDRINLTRRRFIAGAAGALSLVVAPTRVLAQGATPSASPVAAPEVEQPDMTGASYGFQVGAFNCLAVSDGAMTGPGATQFLFSKTPDELKQQVLSETGLDPNQLTLQKTSIVVDTGSDLVLVDTGSGPAALPQAGILSDNLRREGIQPDDITVVVLTHGHADHIGGNLTAGGNPLYGNARYVISQEEWDFWTDTARVEQVYPADFASAQLASFEQNLLPLEGMIERIDYDAEIVPGITSVAAQGHTPGHMGLKVESGGEMLWVLGDVALHPVELQYPEIVSVADAEPDRMIETRRTLFDQIAGAGQATFNHVDPFPSLGQVAAEGEAWSWQPVEMVSDEEG